MFSSAFARTPGRAMSTTVCSSLNTIDKYTLYNSPEVQAVNYSIRGYVGYALARKLIMITVQAFYFAEIMTP
jgi:hypothetical protein